MENEVTLLANNLIYYRKASGYTQLEIAEKLNYSDKSISKWERGEGVPDVFVLKALAELYGITIDDFFHKETKKITKNLKRRHWYITGLSVGLAWLIAAAGFTILMLIIPDVFPWWLLFMYAFVSSFIITTVFSSVWGRLEYQLISISGLIWMAVLSTYFTVHAVQPMENDWLIIITGAPIEILEVIFYLLRRNNRKKIRLEREKEKDVD